jgi:hypothetical protein
MVFNRKFWPVGVEEICQKFPPSSIRFSTQLERAILFYTSDFLNGKNVKSIQVVNLIYK